jgi:hypothetical protein
MRVLSDTFGAIGDANLIVSETGKLLADHPPLQKVRVDERRCAALPSLPKGCRRTLNSLRRGQS